MTTDQLLEKLERRRKDIDTAIHQIRSVVESRTISEKRSLIIRSVSKSNGSKPRKWSKEQRTNFMATMRAKRGMK